MYMKVTCQGGGWYPANILCENTCRRNLWSLWICLLRQHYSLLWRLLAPYSNGNSVTVIYKRLKLSANWPVGLLAQWLRRWPFASTARVRSPAWAEREKIVRSSAANHHGLGTLWNFVTVVPWPGFEPGLSRPVQSCDGSRTSLKTKGGRV